MDERIRAGMPVRYGTTIVAFILLSIFAENIRSYEYLVLPLLLTWLDGVDGIFLKSNDCHDRVITYKYLDKICDVFSYAVAFVFLYLFFKPDRWLLFFILYRTVGMIAYTLTKNKLWLIVFFDFVKEYMLYLFIFHKKTYLALFMMGKIYFEYWHHSALYLPSGC